MYMYIHIYIQFTLNLHSADTGLYTYTYIYNIQYIILTYSDTNQSIYLWIDRVDSVEDLNNLDEGWGDELNDDAAKGGGVRGGDQQLKSYKSAKIGVKEGAPWSTTSNEYNRRNQHHQVTI